MYSQERRRERYLIIYVWRMLEAQVPNIPQADGNSHKIQAKWHPRRGRECTIPRVETSAPHRVKKLLYASLPVWGQRLFNSLPIEVRNVTHCSVENFKCILDRFLQTVPDEPQIPGYISQRRADTNSLLDMARMAKAHSNSLVEVPMGQSPTDRGGCAPSIAVAQWCQNTQQGTRKGSTITNMELHNLKSGAPHVELCGYIIELWYSAILGFCSHIKTVGSQILRARVKWFSRYLALSREGHNSGIQDHRPALPGVYNSQTVCWAIIEVLTFPGSLHIDIAPATNHNKQHWILIIMQQNCQITRCARQHTMDSVLKSAKLRRDLTGNRTGFTHARSALRGLVSPKLDELLGDKFANRISNKISTFSTQ